MYFLATLNPAFVEAKKKGLMGEWLTQKEKVKVIDDFYRKKSKVNGSEGSYGGEILPLCLDHAGGDDYGFGFVVPSTKRIGRVIDLFNDRKGHLIAKCVLYDYNDTATDIAQGMGKRKEKWGVSVWVDMNLPQGRGGPIIKELTHVAMTKDPNFAKDNSFIHHWGLSEEAVNKVLFKEYYTKGDGLCYASPQLISQSPKGMLNNKYQGMMSFSCN